MAESNSSFLKAFLPGLVLGLIVGASAAVLLPETLNRPSVAGAGTADRTTQPQIYTDEREEMPIDPSLLEPVEGADPQADQPAPTPDQPTEGAPGTESNPG